MSSQAKSCETANGTNEEWPKISINQSITQRKTNPSDFNAES